MRKGTERKPRERVDQSEDNKVSQHERAPKNEQSQKIKKNVKSPILRKQSKSNEDKT